MTTGPSILMAHPGSEMFGSDRVFLDAAVQLAERGWHVQVTLPARGPLSTDLERHGIPVVIVPTAVLRKAALNPRGFLVLLWEALGSLRPAFSMLRRTRPDVVYISTVTIPLWAVVARLLRMPVLWHLHEAETGAPMLIQRLLALPLLLASKIVTNSDFTRDAMSRCYGTLSSRSHVILNPVHGTDVPIAPRAALDGCVRVLYVGRLSPRKGPDVALRAIDLLVRSGMSVRISLAGSTFAGYEWFEEQLRSMVVDLDLEDEVTFLGFVDDVPKLIEGSDVVVVPSVADEGFGNIAVEALLAARPVVVSEAGGLLEAVRGYLTPRTVRPGDAAALAAAIADLVGDWERVAPEAIDDARLAAGRHSVSAFGKAIDMTIRSMLVV